MPEAENEEPEEESIFDRIGNNNPESFQGSPDPHFEAFKKDNEKPVLKKVAK